MEKISRMRKTGSREQFFSKRWGCEEEGRLPCCWRLGALEGKVARGRIPFPPHCREVSALGTEHPRPASRASRTLGRLLQARGTQTLHPTGDAAAWGCVPGRSSLHPAAVPASFLKIPFLNVAVLSTID